MSRIVILLVCLLTAATGLFAQAAPPLLARDPALSQTQIVFVFAGDLWIVARSGGEAKRLTAGVGAESAPSFSPDGKWVAFTGQYDGNTDVFVVNAEGGVPRRLTWHPDDDLAVGWTPDGKKILFTSTRNSYSRFQQLYLVFIFAEYLNGLRNEVYAFCILTFLLIQQCQVTETISQQYTNVFIFSFSFYNFKPFV